MKRAIRIDGDIAYVPLTKGYEAVIDAADAATVGQHNWCAEVRGNAVYAVRSSSGESIIRMHRWLMGTPTGLVSDHIDTDGLNNRRANLRVATHSQNLKNQRTNSHNASGLKGAFYRPRAKRWQSHIRVDGKTHYLGCFKTPEAAHQAYCEASARFHGAFSRTA